MAYTTITVRQEVAKRLKAARQKGESYSDMLLRVLDNQPAESVGEWLDSLTPLLGRGVFTAEESALLSADQKSPRDSYLKRKRDARP